MAQTTTRQWGWTRTGQLWCITCRGETEITCTHASGTDPDTGDCWDCDYTGRMACPTCQR